MMQLLQFVAFFAACHLHFTVGQHKDTKFTITPPYEVFASLGADAIFHWKFSFGDWDDWNHFDEIYWGQTDSGKNIKDKYLTVKKDGKVSVNDKLSKEFQSRLWVIANITQLECDLRFVLRNVTREDEAKFYGCKAIVYGVDYKDGPKRLVIQVPPTITNQSNAIRDVEEGDNVKLLCEASGDPTPSIEWWNNGVLLQSRNTTTELHLQNIERREGGSYVCTAKNRAGAVSHSVLVRVVRYRPYVNKTASSNASIKSWLNHMTGLRCAVDANPAANFTWFKDGRPMLSGANYKYDVSTLTLAPHSAGDFGRYSCKATNIKGIAWHNITVEQLFLPSAPMIDKIFPEMLSIKVTWNRSLDDGGSPILDYRITIIDMNNVQRATSRIHENNFTLQNLRQNRTYRILIQARNVVGYGNSANASVSTLEADPPRILSIRAVPSLMSVNISWNSTNNNTGIKILDYRVILVDTTTQQKREFTGINISNLYVTELKHNRTYVVKVQARNEDGYGWFKIKNFTTLEADRPRVLSIIAVPSMVSVNISWNSTNDNTGIKILDYRIILIDTVTNVPRMFNSSIKLLNLYVTKLKQNRTYAIKVQARNEDGYGRFKSRNFTTLEADSPGPPVIKAIPRLRALLITWKPSPKDINNIKILDYRIKVLNGTFVIQEYDAITNTSLVIKNLADDRTYVVEIQARNDVGFGQTANISVTTLLADLSSTMPTEFVTTSPSITEGVDASKETPTSQKTEYHTVVSQDWTGESGVKEKEPSKNILVYFAPLWIVVTAFASPAVVFMLWKANKKIKLVCCFKRRIPPRRSRELHNRDSESSASTVEDVKEKTDGSHYETITEVLEMHFNHGYTTEEGKKLENEQSVMPNSGRNVYNHLHETTLDSALLDEQQITAQTKQVKQVKQVNPEKLGQKELKSGLGMFSNNEYSHLIHADSFVKWQSPIPSDYSTIASNCLWEICRDRLELQRTIGCGEFGLVMKGLALNVNKNGGWVPVAVKTLSLNGETNELCRKALLSELEVMKDLSPHKHVIQLLACITESEPLCLITEFAPYGDLLGFLRKKRGLRDDYYNVDQLPKRRLTSYQLMQFAWEIADGMDYLSSAKIIHRDLAARNVLLGENLTCKVTDFGLARDIRGQDMYQKMTGGRLPVKWTAIEALLHGIYTTKSDVWSFGVVLFEIVTIGGYPYPDMEVLELIDRLESGFRMEKPRHVTDEVYNLMLTCWNEDPDKRPSFRQLYSTLNHLAKGKQACINLRTYDGRLYENIQMPSRYISLSSEAVNHTEDH